MRWLWLLSLFVFSCSVPAPSAETPYVRAVFDPASGTIPRPTDILRDEIGGRLDIPTDDLDDKTPAEIAFIHALNERDAWPPEMKAEITFTGPLDERTVADNLRVFELTDAGARPIDVAVEGDSSVRPTKLFIAPTEGRWVRGRTYFAAAIGGPRGLVGAGGETVVADAAFYFLRLKTSLLDHASALPGDSAEDRDESATKLEEIRVALAPHFEHLEKLGVARDDVVALWSFSISSRTAIVMDKDEGKMPLPSDFLRDPASGLVDIPIRDDDSELNIRIKHDLATLDGFGLSSNLTFELTAPIDPVTLTPETVRLYALPTDKAPERIDIAVRPRVGDTSVTIEPPEKPLDPDTKHVVVVTKGLKDTDGASIVPMLPGTLAMLEAPVFEDGRSTVGTVEDESAARVEFVRASTVEALEAIDLVRDDVAAAWSFETMSVYERMRQARDAALTAGTPVDPMDIEEVSPTRAALDFPLSALTLLRVQRVVRGAIIVPDFMDGLSRSRRDDDRFELRKVNFTMTIPRGHDENDPLPVAIFGHGLMTERRFVLAIGDALAGEGMAAIAIDLPYHGNRTHCVWSGPQCVVNPLDPGGNQICPDPCERNTQCAPDGRCVDSNGQGNALNLWPLVGFPQASGGAFVDVNSMDGTRDHFHQAVTDLSALRRSLLEGDWSSAIGLEIASDVRYVGQSLGGITGALFVAVHPEMERAVLNVPGADLIDLFRESTVFRSHLDALLEREMIEPGSDEHEQVLNIGRWIMDPIDPHTFAPFLVRENFDTGEALGPRSVLIQMATLDFIIPNENTRILERLSGVPREDYIAEHAFIVVPVEPAYLRGTRDIARLLGRGEMP